jgi:hypothetical protein
VTLLRTATTFATTTVPTIVSKEADLLIPHALATTNYKDYRQLAVVTIYLLNKRMHYKLLEAMSLQFPLINVPHKAVTAILRFRYTVFHFNIIC